VQQKSKRIAGVYAITPDGWSEDALLDVVQAALEEGVSCVQYRDKAPWELDADRKISTAISIALLCQKFDACFIVNDYSVLYLQVILQAHVDGCHVGQYDSSIAQLRSQLGYDILLGASCYNDINLAKQAAQQGADYVAFGAMFNSQTKPNALNAPLNLLTESQSLGIPVVAIGGIDVNTISTVAKYGATAAALMTSLFGDTPNAELTARSARALIDAFEQGCAEWKSNQ
jgi:thiamine-phosphate pyrophosphorylase